MTTLLDQLWMLPTLRAIAALVPPCGAAFAASFATVYAAERFRRRQ